MEPSGVDRPQADSLPRFGREGSLATRTSILRVASVTRRAGISHENFDFAEWQASHGKGEAVIASIQRLDAALVELARHLHAKGRR